MTVSVRMDPLLEKEVALVAQRQGVTQSQFIIAAVRRTLGHTNPHDLMVALQAEETCDAQLPEAGRERPYDTAASKAALRAHPEVKNDDRSAG